MKWTYEDPRDVDRFREAGTIEFVFPPDANPECASLFTISYAFEVQTGCEQLMLRWDLAMVAPDLDEDYARLAFSGFVLGSPMGRDRIARECFGDSERVERDMGWQP